jgi:hypothetical protein
MITEPHHKVDPHHPSEALKKMLVTVAANNTLFILGWCLATSTTTSSCRISRLIGTVFGRVVLPGSWLKNKAQDCLIVGRATGGTMGDVGAKMAQEQLPKCVLANVSCMATREGNRKVDPGHWIVLGDELENLQVVGVR